MAGGNVIGVNGFAVRHQFVKLQPVITANTGVGRTTGIVLVDKIVDDAVEVLDAENLTEAPPEMPGNLGFALLRLGELHRAEQIFREILEKEPEDTDARNSLGMVLLRRNKHALAIRELPCPPPEGPALALALP